LGFCNGNSGDPIFTETFGTGTTSTQLPAGATGYVFNPGDPFDGQYKISNNTNSFGWFDIDDHTANDVNGKMLIINADFTAGEFYRTSIAGLCENTTYEFSSWMINLSPSSDCGGAPIPINVRFEIWDSLDTNLLASGDTGSINGSSSPIWEQYALVFQTLVGQTSVILKMRNNGVGGCGNDLALDDIVFKTCGDAITIQDIASENAETICENQLPYATTLSAIPDFAIFSSHFYQWQQSSDAVNWIDIVGENSSTYNASSINGTTFFRVKVAENAINVNNDFCNAISDVYQVNVVNLPNAPISNGNLVICENDTTPLSVTVPSGIQVNWYDAATGGNVLFTNSTTFNPPSSGVYYAEAETTQVSCTSTARTALQIDYLALPEVTDETLLFCENTNATLRANPTNPTLVTSYLWSTGETTPEIEATTAGTYTVVVSNNTCSATKTITLNQIENPIIETVRSDTKNIVVTTVNTGDFLYSLNGVTFQSSPTFFNIQGGLYTIYVKHAGCENVTTTQHIHFHIPKFFTPNNDGVNDTFNLAGLEFYNTSSVSIFNRQGKLLKSTRNSAFSWNGTLAGQRLPTNDYWYVIIIDGQKFTGHFTLKR
jgi:gliding motility-associated-like protein